MKPILNEKLAVRMLVTGITWAVLFVAFHPLPYTLPYTPLSTGLFVTPVVLAIVGAINFAIHLERRLKQNHKARAKGGAVMELKISPEIKDEVPDSLLVFIKRVIEKERLDGWAVHIWACRREGICTDTTILFGPCETERKTRVLFLHEVAHALISDGDFEDSYWHREGWGKEFDRLCEEYLEESGGCSKELREMYV